MAYEAICCDIFLNTFLKRRLKKKFAEILSILSIMILFMLCVVGTSFGHQYLIRCLSVILCIGIYTFLFFKGKWFLRIFLSICFYGIMTCIDYLGIIIIGQLVEQSTLNNFIMQLIFALLCKTMLLLCVLLIRKWFGKRNENVQIQSMEWLLMFSFPLFTVMTMLVLLFSYQDNNSMMGYLWVSFGLIIINVVMFFLLQYIASRERKLYEMQLLQERNNEKLHYYQESIVNNERQKAILHDYSNQINCIIGLISNKEYDKARQYSTELASDINKSVDVINVNNPIINVLLNQKYHVAQDKKIAVSFTVSDLSGMEMEEKDIVILLSNLIDNAIEATEKIKKEKIIHIKIVLEKHQLIIAINNTVDEYIKIEDNQIATHKIDKNNHGIGLHNIQMVLDKYDGMGMMRCENGRFYYTIVIPFGD